jgi:hypothetical protein
LIEEVQDSFLVVMGHSSLDDALRLVKICSCSNQTWQEMQAFVCDTFERGEFRTLEIRIGTIVQEVLEDFFVVISDGGAERRPDAILDGASVLQYHVWGW